MLSRSAWLGVWSVILQWSRVGSNAAVFIVLSRWLSLSEIGAVAAAQAPFILIQSLQLSVFPDLVIQERDAKKSTLSTLLYIAVGSACVLSFASFAGLAVLNLIKPGTSNLAYAAAFSLMPILWGASAISAGLLRQALDVKSLAKRTSIASLLAGLVAIALGIAGYGGWALVAFSLVNGGLSLLLTARAARWLPALTFDTAYAARVSPKIWALVGRYGFSAMVIPLLQLLTAIQAGHAAAGTLQIAFRVYSMVETLLVVPFKYLILPVLVRAVTQVGSIAPQLLRAITLGAVLFVPTYIGILAAAPVALPLVLGEVNGSAAVPALQLLSFFGLSFVVTSTVNDALVAVGEISAVFRRSAVMFFIVTIPCVIAVRWGILPMLTVYALWGGAVGLGIALVLAWRYFSVTPGDVLLRVWAPGTAAVAMWGAMVLATRLPLPPHAVGAVVKLAVAGIAGPLAYSASMWILNREQLKAVLGMILKRQPASARAASKLSSVAQ